MNPLHPVYVSDLARALDGVSGLDALKNSSILLTGSTGIAVIVIAGLVLIIGSAAWMKRNRDAEEED